MVCEHNHSYNYSDDEIVEITPLLRLTQKNGRRMSLVEWTTLLLGLATALATSITAYAVWHQWRGTIQVEWEPAWINIYEKSIPPHLEIRITIRNYHKFGIGAGVAEVSRCPVKNVTRGAQDAKKHESWEPHRVPLSLDVEPGASESCTICVSPDWASLAERKSVKWRPKLSTKLRVQISIVSKARKRMRMKRHITIPVPNEIIAEVATVAKA